MPSINNLELPVVTVSLTVHELKKLGEALGADTMPMEALIELGIYLKREKAKADALDALMEVVRDKIDAQYAGRKAKDRETVRTDVGLVTYTEAGEKEVIRDRDTLVESLSSEQLRISYKPDLKALKTILKPEAYERQVQRVPTPAKTSLRDLNKDDYHEIDF